MAEGTNEFLKEIDELLGDEAIENDVKGGAVLEDAQEPYVRCLAAGHVELAIRSFLLSEKTS